MNSFHTLIVITFAATLVGCTKGPSDRSDLRVASQRGVDPVRLTDENFEREVLQSERPVLVDAWAHGCPLCIELKPTLRQIAADFAGELKVGELDVDANAFVTGKYEIHRYPTLLVFVDGVEVERLIGAKTRKELRDLLRPFANEASPMDQ